MFVGRGPLVGSPLLTGEAMRRSLIVTSVVTALALLAAGPLAAGAHALQSPAGRQQAGTCALTSYTLTGPFSRVGGVTTFTLGFGGGCVGTSPAAAITTSGSPATIRATPRSVGALAIRKCA